MIKIFLSHPMSGFTPEEVKSHRDFYLQEIRKILGDEEVELVANYKDTLIDDPKAEVKYLIHALKHLPEADIVFFAPTWFKSRGCRIEYMIVQEYNLVYRILGHSPHEVLV